MNDTLLQFQALLPQSLRHEPWLADFSLSQHDIPPRTTLYRMGATPRRLYFIAKGWVGGAIALSTSRRPLTMLRIRGDVIGLDCMDGRKAVEEIHSITGAELISVPMAEWVAALHKQPKIHSFICGELVRDVSILQLMNAVVGRLTAPNRLAFFIYIMLRRSRRTFNGQIETLNLPLTQDEIGQILGLTNVSVNRAFRTLESENLIRTGRQSVTLVDEDRLTAKLELEEWSELMDRILRR